MAPGLAALMIAIPSALGQEPSSASGGLAAAWGWREVSPPRVRSQEFRAVSGVPGRPGWAVAVDGQGSVWLSQDAGQSWGTVLGPLDTALEGGAPDAESLLLEAEALAIDLFAEQVNVPTDEEELALDPDAAEQAAEQAITTLNTEAVGLDQLVRQDHSGLEAQAGAMVWANPTREDELWLSRGDGLWWSFDAGERWRRVQDELAVLCMEAPDDTTLLAGLGGDSAGLWRSTDGGARWEPVRGPLTGHTVLDLERHPQSGRWLAATSDGLYRSDDAVTWTRAPGSPADAVVALHADPHSTDGFWLATAQRVLRTDDGGGRVFSLSRVPLPGAVVLTGGLLPNELLYAGSDGVWESRDGGVTWSPVNEGLRTPRVLDLSPVGEGWLAATGQGLLLLEPLQRSQRTQGAVLTPLSLPSTLDLALTRQGMSPLDAGLVSRATLARRVMPELRLVGDAYSRRSLSADYTTRENEATEDRYWRVQAQLVWGGGSSSTAGDTSFDLGDLDPLGDGDAWFVLGDQVYAVGDVRAIPSAASNLSAEASAYRALLAERVTDLYITRERLILARAQQSGVDLRAQVMHELTIAEIEAMLDGYTDGAFLRAAPADLPEAAQ